MNLTHFTVFTIESYQFSCIFFTQSLKWEKSILWKCVCVYGCVYVWKFFYFCVFAFTQHKDLKTTIGLCTKAIGSKVPPAFPPPYAPVSIFPKKLLFKICFSLVKTFSRLFSLLYDSKLTTYNIVVWDGRRLTFVRR